MKKILITGFSHSGTTILRAIMGNIEEVHEVIDETLIIPNNEIQNAEKNNKKCILIKYPRITSCLPIDKYKDFEIIFLIRNPYYVYSSINKRKIDNNKLHSINNYVKTCELFLEYSNNPNKYQNIHTIKYEEIFENNFEKLKDIFNKIDISYDESIFNNNNRYHKSHSNILYKSIKEKPNEIDHEKYRTWQINQPFVYNDNLSKIDLTKTQINQLKNNDVIDKLYPNFRNIILDLYKEKEKK